MKNSFSADANTQNDTLSYNKNQEDYWQDFLNTGSVTSYLDYKNAAFMQNHTNPYTGKADNK